MYIKTSWKVRNTQNYLEDGREYGEYGGNIDMQTMWIISSLSENW